MRLKPLPSAPVLLLLSACGTNVAHTSAPGKTPAVTALRFGSDVSSACDKPRGRPESAGLAAWAAGFAIKSVVGFASSVLEQATQAEKLTKQSHSHGYLYRLSDDAKSWAPNGTICIRFWYAQVAAAATSTNAAQYGVDAPLAERWNTLALVEQPYVYGEVLVALDDQKNLLSLTPTLLYARRLPDAARFGRNAGAMTVAIDVSDVGGEKPFATHLVELPDVSTGPVLLRASALHGAGSALSASPLPPKEVPAKASRDGDSAGPFNALVTLTSESSATLWASAAAAAFKDEKQKLIDAMMPTPSGERSRLQQVATVAAFDAVTAVLDAERALSMNEEKSKVEGLRNQLQKAKYEADLKLRAAGLPARYGVTAP